MTKRKIGPPRARPKPPPRPEIRLVEEQFSRVALGPEDVIVVRLAVPVQPKELVILRGIVEGKFPGRKVLVLAEGVEIGAMGPGTLDVDERIADAAREWRRAKKEHSVYFYDKVLPKMHLLRSAVVPEEEKKMIDAIEAAEEKLTDLVDGMGV